VHGEAIAAAKTLLRKAVLLRRDLRPLAVRKADDARRFDRLQQRLEADRPQAVAAYLSSGSEPGTLQLVAWLAAQGIPVLLPVLTGPDGRALGQPAWATYGGPDALRVGLMSILEPTTEVVPGSPLADVDLVICPALAANTAGDRLGRGGGWYDRALLEAGPQARLWALLNDDEVLEAIPTQPWDVLVGAIATPTRLVRCSNATAG
jgi:5-formyltetrahydrofolate cyclo-ligase